jgi:hypothetical protein
MLEASVWFCQNVCMQDTHDVQQCPFCELRLPFANELQDQPLMEHPEHEGMPNASARPEPAR